MREGKIRENEELCRKELVRSEARESKKGKGGVRNKGILWERNGKQEKERLGVRERERPRQKHTHTHTHTHMRTCTYRKS